ncbi:coactosin-like protein [Littorina saxatilis]|uniref:coactosin-like protein n=1 Tax=Littorina saxatilis TaxID=31220 RepID=UPI0038B57DB9
MTTIDKSELLEAYEDVRNDTSPTIWMVCTYEGNNICLGGKGEDYDELKNHLGEDDRAFAFVRIIMGDELSKRAKFVLITWSGTNVGGIKRAKMSTDKTLVKNVIKSFAVEIMANDHEEVTLDVIKDTLAKVGGANYGTGVRD